MLDQETKRKINNARDILVGKVPDPKAQVEQITTALIYKFMDDMDRSAEELGGKPSFFTDGFKQYSWGKLMDKKLSGQERLNLYVEAITKMSQNQHIPQLFRNIFKDAFLPYRSPETLHLFLKEINGFTYDNSENLGNAFEYLLSIMGSQGDAGQFRTPRHIIDFIVDVVNPQKDETILDPACGTAGFLIAAYKHIIADHDCKDNITGKPTTKEKPLTPDEKKKMMNNFTGYDISPDMVKLSLVNMYLHGFSEPKIYEYDTLSSEDRWDETYDVIMANPPFMTPKGGIRPHKRFSVQANRSEVLFVDYILEHLNLKGRAGIIVPEGIIFKSENAYKELRKLLVEEGLLAVVSLPSGIFQPYSGVKTSILFFDNQLAKKAKDILFIKIEDDGYSLGAQRRKLEHDGELPRALKILEKFQKVIQGDEKYLTHGDVKGIAHIVAKNEIKSTKDYNLSGERYRESELQIVKSIQEQVEKDLKKYKNFALNQMKPVQEIMKQMQPSIDRITDFINSSQFKMMQKSVQETLNHLQQAFSSANIGKMKAMVEKLRRMNNQKWPMVELGEVCDIFSGSTPARSNLKYWQNGKIPWFTIEDVREQGRIITYAKQKITEEALKNTSVKLLPPKTILLCCSASIGEYAFSQIELTTNQQFNGLVVNAKYKDKLLPEFLYYLSSIFKKELIRLSGKTSFNYVSIGTLKKIKIPLPSLEVQKEIVAEIDGYQKIIDGAKQVVENYQPTIKIDPEWEIVRLVEVCEYEGGTQPPKSTFIYEPRKRYIRLLQIRDYKSDENAAYIPIKERHKICAEEDIMIGRYGPPVFQILRGKTGAYNVALMKCVPDNSRLSNDWLYYFLGSAPVQEKIIGLSARVRQSGVRPDDLDNLIIPLPSLKIQKQIVAKIETEQEAIDQNKKLIEIFEGKIKEKMGEVWGE